MTPSHKSSDGMHPGAGPRSLLIFGAGGRLGGTLVEEALRRGHRVRAVVHHTNPLSQHPRLEVVRGDVHLPRTVQGCFAGIDAVLASLGSAGAARPDVAGTGATVITRLMSENGLTRLITVTGSGAVLPNEEITAYHAIKRDQMARGASTCSPTATATWRSSRVVTATGPQSACHS